MFKWAKILIYRAYRLMGAKLKFTNAVMVLKYDNLLPKDYGCEDIRIYKNIKELKQSEWDLISKNYTCLSG